ncbi:MAG: ATP-binding cassette domain-containing protein [Aureispira sp.]|nr:ATP-binding cassette domain-containing protein [Aureispira sp.]
MANTVSEQQNLKNHPLRRFLRLLSLDRKDISFIYIYAIFAGIIGLSIPVGIQAIINLIALGQPSTSWIVLTLIVALGTAIAGIMKLMQYVITETIQQRIFTRSAFEFAYRIPRFKMEAITSEYAPELANRFFDTLSVQKGIPKILVDLSAASLQILFGLILLALYHPFFVVFGIILLLLIGLVISLSSRPGLSTSISESKYKYKVAYWLEELGRTMGSFKLAGRTQYPLEKTNDLVKGYLKYRKKHFRVVKLQIISVVVLKTLATAALLLIGGLLVINNEMNIGQFVASEIVVIIILNSLEKIILSMETVFDVLTAIEKIGSVTDIPLEDEDGIDFEEIHCPKGIAVSLHNLSYVAGEQQHQILEDIDLDIKGGERVCITGASASGKSTLLRIVIGWYDNFTGSIAYNDIPYKNINTASLRSYMGDYVTEQHLFHGTLAENISMGRQNVSIQDIIAICKKVNLTNYIQTLPEGLNTMIASDGEHLPQGVIKKIILARCIVDTPRLIATEPLLNNMDMMDKQRIIDLLTDRKNPWTLISVSRSAQLAKNCDRIIVMEKGQVIFKDSYEKLKEQPYFYDLFDDIIKIY